jgi:hypothetical protein
MSHDTKWYGTRDGITIADGGTLTATDGITLAGNFDSTMGNLAVTNAMVVGTTLHVTTTSALDGDVNIGKGGATIAATGNTVFGGTLNVVKDFAVATTKFTAKAATGNVYADGTANLKGTVTIGDTTVGKAILISPLGTATAPATGTAANVRIYFDASDLWAKRSDGQYVHWTLA